MKKLFLIVFIISISSLFYFLNDYIKQTNKINVKNNSFYEVWKLESESKHLNPSTLYTIQEGEKKNIYENHFFGYEIKFPKNWLVDNSQTPYYTRFYNENFRLDITFDNLKEIYTTREKFYENTLTHLKEHITFTEDWKSEDFSFKIVEYQRNEIDTIENDLNYYLYLFIEHSEEIFTFQLKTNKENLIVKKKLLKEISSSFKLIQKKNFDLNKNVKGNNPNPRIEYTSKEKKLIIPENKFLKGIYSSNTSDINSELKKIEKELNSTFGSHMFYKGIDTLFDPYIKKILKQNRLPIVTFLLEVVEEKNNETVVEDIIKGKYDKQISSWAKGIEKLNGPVLLRLGNEMNGSWVYWSYKHNYNDADLYKLAYQRFVEIFKERNANNAFFIWNPNVTSSPFLAWNHASLYYPGDKYVDWIGLTAYNFGKTKWGEFNYFEELYEDYYFEYLRSFHGKPMIIGEFGSVETGGNKGKFIEEMFEVIPKKYTNIKIAVWFNKTHGEYDFRYNTSTESKNAFKEGLSKETTINNLK